jgi:hypothetical protein
VDTGHPLLRAKSFHCTECNAINLVSPEDLEEDPKNISRHTMKCRRDTWIEFAKTRAELQMSTSQTLRVLLYVFKRIATKDDRFDAINVVGMDL